MDIGSINSVGSAAGAPLAQAKGPEADRAQGESTVQERGAQFDANAAKAAGIGQTDGEEHTTQDRYGDGRQPWQMAAANKFPADDKSKAEEKPAALRDPSGANGRLIDLSG